VHPGRWYSSLLAVALAASPALADDSDRKPWVRLPRPGSYEAEALDAALAALELTIDPAQQGKRLGRIHVVNQPVFGPRDRFLQFFNLFHYTTRSPAIEREVTLRPGELWDDTKIRETERKLRDPVLTARVVVAPVRSPRPGSFDLLVVTRDVWSLRMNSNFEFQEGQLTELTISLSENNFLGYRKQLAMVFDMDQGKYFIGPLYHDRNMAGTRLQLRTFGGPLFGRASGRLEGAQQSTTLTYPLWSVDSRWAAEGKLTYRDAIARLFQGRELYLYDVTVGERPGVVEHHRVPYEYRLRQTLLQTSVTRSFGRELLHRVSLGHELSGADASVPATFAEGPEVQAAFERDVFPREELASAAVARYALSTSRFVTYHDIDTYDLSEDSRLGPDATVELAVARRELGSDANFVRPQIGGGFVFDWGRDGFVRVSAEASGRVQDGDLMDARVEAGGKVATPARLGGRLVARVTATALMDERSNRFLTLGGRDGLRGYAINQFIGQTRVVANLEARTLPMRLWFTRFGALAFWDVGHATGADGEVTDVGDVVRSFRTMRPRQDLGVGLRFLIPQLSPLVYRFDWAFPLVGPNQTFPGRFTAGVDQAF
jgi:surface antigen Omp85-like protein